MAKTKSAKKKKQEADAVERQILHGLNSADYEHSFDREALNTLEQIPGFDRLLREFFEHYVERIYRIQYTGSHLKITENNFPALYNTFRDTCEVMSLPVVPELYTAWNFNVNAMTIGTERPIVILRSGTVDLLSEDEMRYVIGHELGHIKSNHVLYRTLANMLTNLGRSFLGIPGLLTLGIRTALNHWVRMSEFTADRAGLLACQSPEAAFHAKMKMAGLPKKYFETDAVDHFLDQAREFEEYDYNALDRIAKLYLGANRSHPWTVIRAAEINRWIEDGSYEDVIEQAVSRKSEGISADASFCPTCGTSLQEAHKFCGGCGLTVVAA